MARLSQKSTVWSSLSERASSVSSAAQRRGAALLDRAPAPVQKTWRLLEGTVRESIEDRVPGLAAEAALFTLISLPALLLAIVGSLGFIAGVLGPAGNRELRRVLDLPESFLSERTFATYQHVVDTVLAQQRGDVVSLGILLSVWGGSRAVNRYLETITLAYDLAPRPAWKRRLLALGLTIGAMFGVVAILPPLVLGPRLVLWAAPASLADPTLHILHLLFWPVVVLLVLAAVATLYHVGVPWHTPWRRDLPGAALAMVLWLLASAGLRAYITFTVQKGAVYGQLAVPIAVVLWTYITALAVLLGAEFNSEIERLWPHEEYPWRLPRLTRGRNNPRLRSVQDGDERSRR
ncbi:YihY/virulence factor BrkB family protein [Mycobacterium sp. CVI_P3]|uniref:YihY/virulence factor BrkB family protein n=1 Tax=Mycobacterium pinniadriaticum TaxID=2994102 RepID=A0ABT3S9S7_9MYCO|nr:YihY/virulence factor BrkB family protein [Mycobacterium pinniadriaticum]MCX2929480.1 YihY/virulence factor BrkB family protein [Mycobacterium pinniadriaticum]MCX2935904.1 YihY/virulence factor BrkB family protein [Mycobacterium pinniadriaticum]